MALLEVRGGQILLLGAIAPASPLEPPLVTDHGIESVVKTFFSMVTEWNLGKEWHDDLLPRKKILVISGSLKSKG